MGLGDGQEEDLWPRCPSGYLEPPLPRDAQLLRDALVKGLVNCRSFKISGPGDCGEGPNDNVYKSGHLTPSDAVAVILAIIADSSLPIKSLFLQFETDDAGSWFGSGRIDTARLHMPMYHSPARYHLPALYDSPTFKAGWACIEELLLEHSSDSRDQEWCLHLITHAPSLKKLALHFYHAAAASTLTDELISSRYELPRLQEIKFKSADITLEKIQKLFRSSRHSLRTLWFLHVYLEGEENNWKGFFQDLAMTFPFLNNISFGHLIERSNNLAGKRDKFISFPSLANNPIVPNLLMKGPDRRFRPQSDCRLLQPSGLPVRLTYQTRREGRRVAGVSYQGPSVNAVLKILAESAEISRGIVLLQP